MDFEDLYQEIILDHYRHPRNAARLDHIPEEAVHENPTCGDSIKLELKISPDGTLESVRFDGRGCAISTASASMMTEHIRGRDLGEAENRVEEFLTIMRGERPTEDLGSWGELEALKGVIRYPVRLKCATLAWYALKHGIAAHQMSHRGP
ncbi:MAG TPA: SUF system NifU family Fe-S cluster assembly protein [Spirochaetia bacterium]|nr:SUF system NifU family Fe-S cluster assembly protein [Spirochaetia bacterium]